MSARRLCASSFLRVLLSLCLLMGSVGAITHDYTHLGRPDTPLAHEAKRTHGKGGAAGTIDCMLCLAFAGCAAALASVFGWTLPALSAVWAACPLRRGIVSILRLAYRSRAPPAFVLRPL